jgi:hypothetical protein
LGGINNFIILQKQKILNENVEFYEKLRDFERNGNYWLEPHNGLLQNSRQGSFRSAARGNKYPLCPLCPQLLKLDEPILNGKSDRSGGAGRKRSVGKMNSRPALACPSEAERRRRAFRRRRISYQQNWRTAEILSKNFIL